MPTDEEPETEKYIFTLSGEMTDLAKAEILAVAQLDDCHTDDTVLVAECSLNPKRLALTKRVYNHLFECKRSDLEKNMKKFDWESVYKQNFRIRVRRSNRDVDESEYDIKKLAKIVWDSVSDPVVEMEATQTKIDIVLTEKNAYCGLVKYVTDEAFSKRRSHLRPHNQPTSMNPKIARACVNLSGIQVGDTVVDPFCGAGGILLEAGLMRFGTRGYDIDKNLLVKCERNLDHYKVKRFKLEHLDALKLSEMADYVVTDLPYGKSSMVTDEKDKLYADFLGVLARILKNKAVLIFPDFVDYKKIISKSKFAIEKEFSLYVHASLTRKIVLLKKKD